jgi:hypothetical protein
MKPQAPRSPPTAQCSKPISASPTTARAEAQKAYGEHRATMVYNRLRQGAPAITSKHAARREHDAIKQNRIALSSH